MVPEEDASTATMRKYKQVLQTHLALTECVSFIELVGITDLDLVSKVRVRMMSIRTILMNIEVPSSRKPLFLMIAINHEGESEGVLHTGREQEAEVSKIATYVASAIMYRMMFELLVEPDDIA